MSTKRAVDVEPDRDATANGIRRLLGGLPTDELEQIAVEVIREHRRRLQLAQELFEALERAGQDHAGPDALPRLHRDYRLATLNLHGQHALVSLVVELLGYVPEVDGEAPADIVSG